MKKNIIITGGIGAGKTRYIKRLIAKRKKNWSIIYYDGPDFIEVESNKDGPLMIVIDEANYFMNSEDYPICKILELDYKELYLCSLKIREIKARLFYAKKKYEIRKVYFKGLISIKQTTYF